MYQSETRKAFSVVLNIFEKLWCLPNGNEGQLKFWLKSSLLRFLGSLGWWGVFFHLIMNKNHTNASLSQDLGIVISFVSNQLAPILFVIYHKEWLRLLHLVTDFSEYGKLQDFERKAKYLNLYPVLFLIYSTVGLIIYGIIGFLNRSNCERLNEEKGLQEICGTLAPAWLPFNGDNSSIELAVFLAQVVTTLLVIYSTICIDVLPLSITELIISHVDHFKLLFNEIFEEEDCNVQAAKFKFCVKYHSNIIRMANELSRLTKITLGHYSLTGSAALGFIGSQLLQTSSIHQSTYFSKWYISDPKMIKNVQFVMGRSQKPLVLTALPFGYYNYPLFLMVIKTAYSYLTLINETM